MEVFGGRKPKLHHLRVFGCTAYVQVPSQKRKKLDSKAYKCILVGYSSDRKAYRLWNPTWKQVIISRDVVFDETKLWKHWKESQDVEKAMEVINIHLEVPSVPQEPLLEKQEEQQRAEREGEVNSDSEKDEDDEDDHFQDAQESPIRSRRTRRSPGMVEDQQQATSQISPSRPLSKNRAGTNFSRGSEAQGGCRAVGGSNSSRV